MQQKLKHIKTKISNNTKVIENYFFMTSLPLISSAFGILLYPYLIRNLGGEAYGLYVFLLAIVAYFIDLIGFGFQLTGLKLITDNLNDSKQKSVVLSGIISAKVYLAILSVLIIIPLILFVDKLNEHRLLLTIIFTQIIAEIIFPQWYFRAIQQMKVVTWYQLSFRIASVPFIFILIKEPSDIMLYAIISALSVIVPAALLLNHLVKLEKLHLRLVSFKKTIVFLQESLPLFISSFIETVKQESTTLIIGLFLGMRDVAIFDLAKKVIMLPRMMLANINVSIFPKLRLNPTAENIRRIIRYEWFIGLLVVSAILLAGYPAVYVLGGQDMLDAYPVTVLLSFTLLSWLIVGAYIYHIFIPNQLNKYITINQSVSLITFAILLIPGLIWIPGIYAVVLPLVLSSITEILFSHYLIRKKNCNLTS